MAATAFGIEIPDEFEELGVNYTEYIAAAPAETKQFGQELKQLLIDNANAWKYQRLIWIGYYKNNDNNQCLFNILPKDVIAMIIDLLKIPLSLWKCTDYKELISNGCYCCHD